MRYSIVKDKEERLEGVERFRSTNEWRAPEDRDFGEGTEVPSGSGLPGHVDANRNVVLYGHGEECRRIDFEIGKRGGDRSGEVSFVSLPCELKGDLLIVSGLSGELNFEIGVDGSGVGGGLGQAGADGHHGKFCAAGDLNHVEVAIAVAGVEGFDGDGDEEVALSLAAGSLPARGVADAIGLMKRVRDVVGERALLENPLGVGEGKYGQKQQRESRDLFCEVHGRSQNFRETDNRAAPKAPAVTIATGPWADAIPWTFSPLLFWL